MKQSNLTDYGEAMANLRFKLKSRWGYASRVAKKLKGGTTTNDVYNVAWGRVKNAKILQALIDEAKSTEQPEDQCLEMVTEFLNSNAA